MFFLSVFASLPLGEDHLQQSPHTPPHLKDDPKDGETAGAGSGGQGGKVDLDQVIMELNNFPEENGAAAGNGVKSFLGFQGQG